MPNKRASDSAHEFVGSGIKSLHHLDDIAASIEVQVTTSSHAAMCKLRFKMLETAAAWQGESGETSHL